MSATESGAAGPPRARGADAVLRERARELALAREEQQAVASIALLPFAAGGERYAIEVTCVHQIADAGRAHPLLGAPRGVLGALMARTRPAPVFDLRHLLGLEGGGLSDLQRIVVVDDDGDLFGIAVERVERQVQVPMAELREAQGGPFRWMAPGRLAVLDPARLGLARPEGGRG